jgi:DNA-directed RNA polymerase specialized sigma24 family protein
MDNYSPLIQIEPTKFWKWVAAELGPEQVRLLEWRLLQDRTLQEIADRLHCKPEDVRPLIHRLMRSVRVLIDGRERGQLNPSR